MKRFVCTLMALAMTLALAIPAFAGAIPAFAGESVNSGHFSTPSGAISRSLKGDTKTPTVKVLVPREDSSTDWLILNPYALPVAQSKIISGGTGDLKDQIISKPLFVGSLSDVPLNVGVKVVATKEGAVVLASSSLAEDEETTTKSVFVWGQMVSAGTSSDGKIPNTPTSFSSEYDEEEESMVLVVAAATGATNNKIYQIPAAESTTNVTKANWGCMKFFGDAVKSPKEEWTGSDKLSLAVTFSFTASMNE